MNDSTKPSHAVDAENQLEGPKQPAHPSWARTLGEPLPPEADYRNRLLDPNLSVAVPQPPSRAPGISPWLFVMATALNTMVASFLAVIITLGVVRQERTGGQQREAVLPSAYARPTAGGRNETTSLQPIDLRPIGSPNHPLRLEALKPAPLLLQIEPDDAAREPFILALSGVPAGTILSGAVRMGSDTWLLSPGSADQLQIALPEASTSVFEVTVTLRRTNGVVAAQTKAWLAVLPPASLAAPQPASPTAAAHKIDDTTAKDILAKADRLLAKSDVIGARTLYQRAAEMGSGSAALALGTTYDPKRLWSFGAFGMVGNRERAKQWYLRARELGHPEANARLDQLDR
jgi:hypothetical protein